MTEGKRMWRWLLSKDDRHKVRLLLTGKGNQLMVIDYPIDHIPRYGRKLPSHELIEKILKQHMPTYSRLAEEFEHTCRNLRDIPNLKSSEELYWQNGWFPPMDIVALSGMLIKYKPKTLMEIGSGVSTLVAAKTRKDYALPTKIISIDPEPREDVEKVVDEPIRKRLEKCNLKPFEQLRPNDMVFVDGSHRCFMNNDVTVFFLEILPRLRKGVIVQIHDIYWPYDYPAGDHFYNEQYLVGIYLLAHQPVEILWPSYYLTRLGKRWAGYNKIQRVIGRKEVAIHGGSFWFKVT